MRYESKSAFLRDIRSEHDALCALLKEIPESRYGESGVWGDGWTIVDLVAHLAEWQRMFLDWYREGLEGAKPQIPAPGYKYREIPALNRAIWAKYRTFRFAEVQKDFESGYREILDLVQKLPPSSLLKPGKFAWTGKNPLTTYLGANTASHYRFAIKVLRRWLRGLSKRTAKRTTSTL